MDRKVILAVYADLRTAQSVVRRLLQKGFQRKDVRLAVENTNRDQRRALVSVTTLSGLVDRAMEIIKRQKPLTFDKHDESWQHTDLAGLSWMLNPEQYIPMELPEHDPRRTQFRAS